MDARFDFLALLLLLMMFDAHSAAVLGWKRDPTVFSEANTRRRLLVSHGRNPCRSGVSKVYNKIESSSSVTRQCHNVVD